MFKIENHIIGGAKVFIIAEIGINHQGNLKKCKKLIDAAKKSGADAVKLQICNPNFSYNRNTLSYKIFKKNFLNFQQLKTIKRYAAKKKITIFATPGDFQSLETIKKLNFPAIKLSSGLLTNEALIVEICKLKKPMIFSTGLAFMHEIKKISSILNKFKIKHGILKCTSLYPCPENSINLKSIKTLRKKFPKATIGYSDHTKDIDACVAAVSFGAKIIEKHITIKNSLKVPDQKVSCDPSQFKILVKKIRYIEKITGDENSFPCQAEIKRRENYHRSIISVKNILKDEFFNKNNIALKRSREKIKGLHPKFFFKILGKKAKKNISKDTRITRNHY